MSFIWHLYIILLPSFSYISFAVLSIYYEYFLQVALMFC